MPARLHPDEALWAFYPVKLSSARVLSGSELFRVVVVTIIAILCQLVIDQWLGNCHGELTSG